jgi:5-methylcytosine-specific restriction enzyme A
MTKSALNRKIQRRRRELAHGPAPMFERQRKREAYDRKALFARDSGRCAACGTDMDAVKKRYQAADFIGKQVILEDFEIPAKRASGDFWDGDHIVPVIEGGSSDLSNMRTLCIRCHKKASNELAAKKAKALRVAKKFNREFAAREPHAEEVL